MRLAGQAAELLYPGQRQRVFRGAAVSALALVPREGLPRSPSLSGSDAREVSGDVDVPRRRGMGGLGSCARHTRESGA